MTVIAQRGKSFPLGATVYPSGVNFSVYSKSATGVQLLLFNRADDEAPDRTIQLSANSNRTGDYWHVFVPECQSGQVYGYRVDGPFDPEAGHRYDPNKVLLDPYGKCVSAHNYSRTLASNPGDNVAACMKSVVADSRLYDWEGDMPLNRPFAETIIYEVHVAGFTGHVSSDVSPEKRGSYQDWSKRFPTSTTWALQLSNCFRSSNLTHRTLRPVFPIIGGTLRCLSLLRILVTVPGPIH